MTGTSKKELLKATMEGGTTESHRGWNETGNTEIHHGRTRQQTLKGTMAGPKATIAGKAVNNRTTNVKELELRIKQLEGGECRLTAIRKKAAVEALEGVLGVRSIRLIKFNPDKTISIIPNRSTTLEGIIREIKDTKTSIKMGLHKPQY